MYFVISPARNMRPADIPGFPSGNLLFPKEAKAIAESVKKYSPWQLESLLGVNPQRAMDLYDNYQRFHVNAPGTPALFTYFGAAFRNLNPWDFTAEELVFTDKHLRILSALYGMLRPSDGILPYRLGLDKKGFLVAGKPLYEYWGRKIYDALFGDRQPVVCLTSGEYFKLLAPYIKPSDVWVNCRFKVKKPGQPPRGTVSTVRAARGQMARFIIKNQITNPEGMKHFHWDGYQYISSSSTPQRVPVRSGQKLWHPLSIDSPAFHCPFINFCSISLISIAFSCFFGKLKKRSSVIQSAVADC